MRAVVCHVLMVLQTAVPPLCHGHMHGADCDPTNPDALAPRRWIPPHIHTHHLPFWLFGGDGHHDSDDEDDHEDGAVPGGPAALGARAGAPLAYGNVLLFPAADAVTPALAFVFLAPPRPVALSPPAAGPPGLHPPLYLVTLSLLI
jgi:hypothetical protein